MKRDLPTRTKNVIKYTESSGSDSEEDKDDDAKSSSDDEFVPRAEGSDDEFALKRSPAKKPKPVPTKAGTKRPQLTMEPSKKLPKLEPAVEKKAKPAKEKTKTTKTTTTTKKTTTTTKKTTAKPKTEKTSKGDSKSTKLKQTSLNFVASDEDDDDDFVVRAKRTTAHKTVKRKAPAVAKPKKSPAKVSIYLSSHASTLNLFIVGLES